MNGRDIDWPHLSHSEVVAHIRAGLPIQLGGPMDPVTAALNLGTEVVKLLQLVIENTPDDVKAAQAQRINENLERWHELVNKVVDRFKRD